MIEKDKSPQTRRIQEKRENELQKHPPPSHSSNQTRDAIKYVHMLSRMCILDGNPSWRVFEHPCWDYPSRMLEFSTSATPPPLSSQTIYQTKPWIHIGFSFPIPHQIITNSLGNLPRLLKK